MESKSSGVWRHVALALITFILGLGAGAFTSMSRADVEHIVKTEAPYLEDKKAIETKLDDLSGRVAEVDGKLDKLIEQEAARGK